MRTSASVGWALLGVSLVPWLVAPVLLLVDGPTIESLSVGLGLFIVGEGVGAIALLILGREAIGKVLNRFRILRLRGTQSAEMRARSD